MIPWRSIGLVALLAGAACGGIAVGGSVQAEGGGIDAGGQTQPDGESAPEAECNARTSDASQGVAILASCLFPRAIAVDSTSVYWSGLSVMKVPVNGGSPLTVGAPTALAFGLAVDSASVYWTMRDVNGGGVEKTSLHGGTPIALALRQNVPWDLTVDSTSVYWANADSIMKAPLGGGTALALVSPDDPSPVRSPGGIAVDKTSVYWSNVAGAIMKVSLGGGTQTTLATGQDLSVSIALNGSSVYWANPSGTVMKVSIFGGALQILASGGHPQGITVDGTNVYWTDEGDVRDVLGNFINSGTVMKVPIDGGSPQVVAAGFNRPGRLTTDNTSVYWANWGTSSLDGSIMKAPK